MEGRLDVVFVMGPTASGKSALAVALARLFDGEIVSVDSAQVYRGMDIGTAKPSPAMREEIDHHLIDIRDPRESWSAADFCAEASAAVEDIRRRGRLPILAGGTGLYFRALADGLSPLPAADPRIRAAIAQQARIHGWEHLHARLQEIDPGAARRIHPNDPQRLQRALEVFELTGKPLSQLQHTADNGRNWRVLRLVVAPQRRRALDEVINLRFNTMLKAGFIDEVRGLYERGDLDPSLPAIRAVGYRQIWRWLAGDITETQMLQQAISATRQLAKRQLTWLRRESGALWLYHAPDSPASRARRIVEPFLHLPRRRSI